MPFCQFHVNKKDITVVPYKMVYDTMETENQKSELQKEARNLCMRLQGSSVETLVLVVDLDEQTQQCFGSIRGMMYLLHSKYKFTMLTEFGSFCKDQNNKVQNPSKKRKSPIPDEKGVTVISDSEDDDLEVVGFTVSTSKPSSYSSPAAKDKFKDVTNICDSLRAQNIESLFLVVDLPSCENHCFGSETGLKFMVNMKDSGSFWTDFILYCKEKSAMKQQPSGLQQLQSSEEVTVLIDEGDKGTKSSIVSSQNNSSSRRSSMSSEEVHSNIDDGEMDWDNSRLSIDSTKTNKKDERSDCDDVNKGSEIEKEVVNDADNVEATTDEQTIYSGSIENNEVEKLKRVNKDKERVGKRAESDNLETRLDDENDTEATLSNEECIEEDVGREEVIVDGENKNCSKHVEYITIDAIGNTEGSDNSKSTEDKRDRIQTGGSNREEFSLCLEEVDKSNDTEKSAERNKDMENDAFPLGFQVLNVCTLRGTQNNDWDQVDNMESEEVSTPVTCNTYDKSTEHEHDQRGSSNNSNGQCSGDRNGFVIRVNDQESDNWEIYVSANEGVSQNNMTKNVYQTVSGSQDLQIVSAWSEREHNNALVNNNSESINQNDNSIHYSNISTEDRNTRLRGILSEQYHVYNNSQQESHTGVANQSSRPSLENYPSNNRSEELSTNALSNHSVLKCESEEIYDSVSGDIEELAMTNNSPSENTTGQNIRKRNRVPENVDLTDSDQQSTSNILQDSGYNSSVLGEDSLNHVTKHQFQVSERELEMDIMQDLLGRMGYDQTAEMLNQGEVCVNVPPGGIEEFSYVETSSVHVPIQGGEKFSSVQTSSNFDSRSRHIENGVRSNLLNYLNERIVSHMSQKSVQQEQVQEGRNCNDTRRGSNVLEHVNILKRQKTKKNRRKQNHAVQKDKSICAFPEIVAVEEVVETSSPLEENVQNFQSQSLQNNDPFLRSLLHINSQMPNEGLSKKTKMKNSSQKKFEINKKLQQMSKETAQMEGSSNQGNSKSANPNKSNNRKRKRTAKLTMTRRSKKDATKKDEQVWCVCRSPDISRFMIGCDNCDEWYHGTCIGITRKEAETIDKFFCDACLVKNPRMRIIYKSGVKAKFCQSKEFLSKEEMRRLIQKDRDSTSAISKENEVDDVKDDAEEKFVVDIENVEDDSNDASSKWNSEQQGNAEVKDDQKSEKQEQGNSDIKICIKLDSLGQANSSVSGPEKFFTNVKEKRKSPKEKSNSPKEKTNSPKLKKLEPEKDLSSSNIHLSLFDETTRKSTNSIMTKNQASSSKDIHPLLMFHTYPKLMEDYKVWCKNSRDEFMISNKKIGSLSSPNMQTLLKFYEKQTKSTLQKKTHKAATENDNVTSQKQDTCTTVDKQEQKTSPSVNVTHKEGYNPILSPCSNEETVHQVSQCKVTCSVVDTQSNLPQLSQYWNEGPNQEMLQYGLSSSASCADSEMPQLSLCHDEETVNKELDISSYNEPNLQEHCLYINRQSSKSQNPITGEEKCSDKTSNNNGDIKSDSESKKAHNVCEKYRRRTLQDSFYVLKQELQGPSGESFVSKKKILQEAKSAIHSLESTSVRLQEEISKQVSHNEMLQRRLDSAYSMFKDVQNTTHFFTDVENTEEYLRMENPVEEIVIDDNEDISLQENNENDLGENDVMLNTEGEIEHQEMEGMFEMLRECLPNKTKKGNISISKVLEEAKSVIQDLEQESIKLQREIFKETSRNASLRSEAESKRNAFKEKMSESRMSTDENKGVHPTSVFVNAFSEVDNSEQSDFIMEKTCSGEDFELPTLVIDTLCSTEDECEQPTLVHVLDHINNESAKSPTKSDFAFDNEIISVTHNHPGSDTEENSDNNCDHDSEIEEGLNSNSDHTLETETTGSLHTEDKVTLKTTNCSDSEDHMTNKIRDYLYGVTFEITSGSVSEGKSSENGDDDLTMEPLKSSKVIPSAVDRAVDEVNVNQRLAECPLVLDCENADKDNNVNARETTECLLMLDCENANDDDDVIESNSAAEDRSEVEQSSNHLDDTKDDSETRCGITTENTNNTDGEVGDKSGRQIKSSNSVHLSILGEINTSYDKGNVVDKEFSERETVFNENVTKMSEEVQQLEDPPSESASDSAREEENKSLKNKVLMKAGHELEISEARPSLKDSLVSEGDQMLSLSNCNEVLDNGNAKKGLYESLSKEDKSSSEHCTSESEENETSLESTVLSLSSKRKNLFMRSDSEENKAKDRSEDLTEISIVSSILSPSEEDKIKAADKVTAIDSNVDEVRNALTGQKALSPEKETKRKSDFVDMNEGVVKERETQFERLVSSRLEEKKSSFEYVYDSNMEQDMHEDEKDGKSVSNTSDKQEEKNETDFAIPTDHATEEVTSMDTDTAMTDNKCRTKEGTSLDTETNISTYNKHDTKEGTSMDTDIAMSTYNKHDTKEEISLSASPILSDEEEEKLFTYVDDVESDHSDKIKKIGDEPSKSYPPTVVQNKKKLSDVVGKVMKDVQDSFKNNYSDSSSNSKGTETESSSSISEFNTEKVNGTLSVTNQSAACSCSSEDKKPLNKMQLGLQRLRNLFKNTNISVKKRPVDDTDSSIAKRKKSR